MFLDASAVIAILSEEKDAAILRARLDAARTPFTVSPLSVFEMVTGLARKKAAGDARHSAELLRRAQVVVAAFLQDLGAREIDVTPDIGRAAQKAAMRYGKVTGHRADLNFGDCFAYACARTEGVPLLFTGDDFSRTDVNEAFV